MSRRCGSYTCICLHIAHGFLILLDNQGFLILFNSQGFIGLLDNYGLLMLSDNYGFPIWLDCECSIFESQQQLSNELIM